jgi:iron-sulfur cluster assembly 2
VAAAAATTTTTSTTTTTTALPSHSSHLQLHQQGHLNHFHTVSVNTSFHTTSNSTTTLFQLQRPLFNSTHRTMVTVTQTKVAELPKEEEDDNEIIMDVSTNHSSSSSSSTTTATTSSPSATTTTPTYVTHSTSLIVTPNCLKRVEKLIQQRQQQQQQSNNDNHNNDDNDSNPFFFLRVFVDAGGCSGFQYQFEIDNHLEEAEGDIVVVSAKSHYNDDKHTDDNNNNNNNNNNNTPSSPLPFLQPRIVIDETSLGFLEGSTLDYVTEMIKSSFVVKDNPKSESACGCGSSFALKNFSANPAKD